MIERPELPLTDRAVQLRPFEMSDAGDVTAACQDREISRWTDAIPWPYDEDHARTWITGHPGLWARGVEAPFAIVGVPDGRFLGAISLIFPEDRPPAAGYWVARWGRNRGVATTALTIITDWGFETLGIELITLATMLGNVASERVAQKAGYALVGETSNYRPPRNPDSVYSVKEWERRHPSVSA
jgi:RimJ/RimL family protein N-acetyltransferase